MGNFMSYNSDQLNETASSLGRASGTAGDASGVAGGQFEGLDTFFGSGAGEISKQLGSLQTSLGNVQGIVQRQSGEMFNLDGALASVASAIEVPTDFVKNEQNRYTTYHNEILEKLDGKSVNDGSQVSIDGTLDESGIKTQKSMGNITSAIEATEEKYDESSVIGSAQEMANVNKAGGDELEKYDERSGIAAAEEMASISRAGGDEQEKYDESSAISTQEEMTNISKGGGLSIEEIRDRSRINAQEALKNFSEGKGGLEMQRLRDATGALSGMNPKGKSALESLRNDFKEGTAGIGRIEAQEQMNRAIRTQEVPSLADIGNMEVKKNTNNNAEKALEEFKGI